MLDLSLQSWSDPSAYFGGGRHFRPTKATIYIENLQSTFSFRTAEAGLG